MRVEVMRPPGDMMGPEINDSLILTEDVAREHGRVEIDRNSTSRELISLAMPLRAWEPPGELVDVADSDGTNWRGMLTSWSVAYSRDDQALTAETTITVEREAL